MKRLDQRERGVVENPAVDAFLEEIAPVCKKHGMSLGHEDQHGSFLVEDHDESNIEWLRKVMVSGCYTKDLF